MQSYFEEQRLQAQAEEHELFDRMRLEREVMHLASEVSVAPLGERGQEQCF